MNYKNHFFGLYCTVTSRNLLGTSFACKIPLVQKSLWRRKLVICLCILVPRNDQWNTLLKH